MLKLLGKVFLKAIGGSRNERLIRTRMEYVRQRINPLEPQMRALSDEGLLERGNQLRRRLADGEPRESIKPEAFALVREASRRGRDHRQFDVQLVAGLILDEGNIAECATGEGKTVACYPAIYMTALAGMHTHVVTVNDYLVQRDAEFAKPIFELLGVTVGYVIDSMPAYGPEAELRRQAYACDVTYGTNSSFGFDYLRDNMKMSVADQVQGPLDFAIVDEVDSILIDEARTPLIISGPAYGRTDRYSKADAVARELISRNRPWDQANRRAESIKRELKALAGEEGKAKGDETGTIRKKVEQAEARLEQADEELSRRVKHYEIELDRKSAHMTHDGVGSAQEIAGVGSFYVGVNMEWPHLMEQALRAHLVYERDTDYVVRQGEVVIVDQFTGRLQEGREWADGLHQAVCAKERVPVKEENQTLATITLQNFFRLYGKLAGMTGTAITEAAEFVKIYGLDVVCVPTHRPLNRLDYNDRIYAGEDAKFSALVEEINAVSRSGRPVLVGTTSIEKSERLSEMLKHTYGTEHQVLNGRVKDATAEGEIVKTAGTQRSLKKGSETMVGMVTIATNMAGRGTDIKLGPGVVRDTCRVPSADKLRELGLPVDPLYPPGINKCCMHCEQYDPATNCANCFKPKLDPGFPLRGRTDCRAEVPCGLHIVGTERHEARRIDNQLRGRSGRLGDPGSSRFFLSIRDDLMAIFAGEWTLKVLGWLGLQGDVAIEDKRVSKGIARAQKKVEERNFDRRKNLLEYDEVMDYQRRRFYSQRQRVLEGRDLEGQVTEMIREVIDEAVDDYLGGDYRQRCIAEWAGKNLHVSVAADQIRAETPDDLDDLENNLRTRAKEEAGSTITITLGEYMDADMDRREWDLRGLSSWAMSRFGVNVSQNQLRKMMPDEVAAQLNEAACERIDRIDLTPLGAYLADNFVIDSLAEWARAKFGIGVTAEQLGGPDTSAERVRDVMTEKVVQLYRRREIEYPVEYAMDMMLGQTGPGNVYAVGQLVEWANRKYDAGLTTDDLRDRKPGEIYELLVDLSSRWSGDDALTGCIRRGVGSDPPVGRAVEFAKTRFDTDLTEADFDGDVLGRLREAGRRFLRREMTELERYVLLQIYDASWKDHLLGMDHLESGIGLRGFAEQDPRVAYKREGARQFQEMLAGVRDKVTDMIFKVSLAAGEEMASVYQISSMVHEQLSGYDHLTQEMAEQGARPGETRKVETIVRDMPRVGRNDPCPCGSGKKYKKCCGKV